MYFSKKEDIFVSYSKIDKCFICGNTPEEGVIWNFFESENDLIICNNCWNEFGRIIGKLVSDMVIYKANTIYHKEFETAYNFAFEEELNRAFESYKKDKKIIEQMQKDFDI